MSDDIKYLSEAEIIRRAEQERSKAMGEFFSRLFERQKAANMPISPVPAE